MDESKLKKSADNGKQVYQLFQKWVADREAGIPEYDDDEERDGWGTESEEPETKQALDAPNNKSNE